MAGVVGGCSEMLTRGKEVQQMQTLDTLLEDLAERYGSRSALLYKPRYRTESWTYRQLFEQAGQMASWLRGQGVEKGDRVVIWAPNNPWWVVSFFGCLRLGAVVVPLDIRSSPDFVRCVVTQTEPRLALVSRLTAQDWTYDTPATPVEELEGLVPRGTTDDSSPAARRRAMDDRPAIALPEGIPHSVVSSDDLAEIIFTSGTTGDPKGVMLTHGNIMSDLQSVNLFVPNVPHFRLLSILPLSHMLEQTVGLLLPMLRGASIFYPASRQSTLIFQALQEQSITNMVLVPQALQLFMAAIEREVKKQGKERQWHLLGRLAKRLPERTRHLLFRPVYERLGGKLEFFVSGGAPLSPELIGKWDALGIPVLQGYGTTEAAPVITGEPLDQRNPLSVGKPVAHVQVKITPDGEILVKGPNITPGYWHNQRATEEAFEDGWYKTGDLGRLDDKGYLYLLGRKKDRIVLSNGQNVYPDDVERALKEIDGVQDAVVLGMPTPDGAEVHAALLLEPGSPGAAAVVRQANSHLAPHQQIRGYTLWPDDDFPRTHTLKVKKHEVLAALLEGQQAGAAEEAPASETQEGVAPLLRIIAELSGVDASQLFPQSTLAEDAGLDSLGRVELLAAIEAELGVYLDESLVGPSTTVGDLEVLVGSQARSARPEFAKWPLSLSARVGRSLVQWPAFGLLGLVAPAQLLGLDNLRRVKPPVLFVANHTSHFDSPTLLRCLPAKWRRRTTVAAAADYFFSSKALGAFVSLLLNAFPFSRTEAIRPTLEHSAWLLDHGWSILIYPEGTRSITGEMAPFKAGVGLLAVEMGVPVVPVHVQGLFEVLPKGRSIPHRAPVTVTFGPPLRFLRGTTYEAASAQMEEAVRALMVSN
jgi:long-chain acyl-CoA synthetase